MGEHYRQLVEHLNEIYHINRATSLLRWDQQVSMPPGGAHARAGVIATLSRLEHERFTSPQTADLLAAAQAELNGAAYDSDEASMLRVVGQDYDRATRLPAELVADYAEATASAHKIWTHARQTNDFAAFEPALERIVDLALRRADQWGYTDHPYDALMQQYERGMTTARVRELFDGHKPQLVALIAAIKDSGVTVSDAILRQRFPIDQQNTVALKIVEAFGYDFKRGRQDVAVHPFAMRFSRGDARITTRFTEDYLPPALFGTFHEGGHAMYEQGISETIDGTMIGCGASLGMHESQSRLWENLVGRSRGFWGWALPQLQAAFPDQLGSVDLETFYRAINAVQPSYIRVEADEATYNLHIMLRFELESDLVAGKLKVADLPREWNARFEAYFGMTPPTDTVGVLQDVHWSSGLIGYFPTYALGNLLSVQFYNEAIKAHPTIPAEIAAGKFDTLLNWLCVHIYQHGRKFTAQELTERITGGAIRSEDYIQYLQTKFGDLYNL
ncbi:MAG: carboxypeptidase M32 [Chloroflexi bacterium]|nr:carboxypeptidase M32 [Chloroflexota bacterium]